MSSPNNSAITVRSRRLLRAPLVTCVVCAMCVLPGTSHAQNSGKISGTVTDASTNEPLIGCNVSIPGTSLGASTGPDGSYFILNVAPGRYDLQASLVGYKKELRTGLIVNVGRTTTADFSLPAEAVQGEEIVIQAVRPDVEPEKTSTSAIIRPEEVQSLAGIRDVGDILGLAADITDGHFRGGREGEEYYTLQGMGIVNPLDNSTAFLPIMSAVEEVEVITSGFGAQYGNAQSGVVNIAMKEGRADAWRTRIEARSRAPGRKHFGPSVFDPGANPYLALLLQMNTWLQGDPQTNTPYYTSMASGLKDRFGGDTLVQLQVARTLWQMQMHRDLNRNYGKNLDYSLEAATGGPIDDNLRMFIALRTNSTWPVFPTQQPDVQRQIMGNIVADVGQGAALRFSGGYTLEDANVFPSSNSLGYYNWLWDRISSIDYEKTDNLQLGTRFTQALSPSTFYEIKLSGLRTSRKTGSTPSPSSVPDSLIVNPQNRQIDWDKIIPQIVRAPDQFYYLRGDDTFRDELTTTFSAEASLTSQVTRSHLINAGLQFNYFTFDVTNYLGVRQGLGGPTEVYTVKPYEGALYVQDKMEFEGMIANVGLRFDLWNSNSNYYSNVFAPYTVIDSAGNPSNNPANAPQTAAPLLGRLQPRVGVSFPVSVNTVFHLNYGSFMQRPSFQYVIASRSQQASSKPILLGNPRLEPEVTNSYDIGVTQGLGEGFTIDVSGYYKDVKNLIEQATYTSTRLGQTYNTYFNRDYADIRGFRIALTKRRGNLAGSINYQFSVATGKSATPTNAPPAFIQDTSGAVTTRLDKVPIRDILLDFDRTHNLVINVAYNTDEDWGPEILGGHPLGDLVVSASSFIRSGRPYTSSLNTKLINGARTPTEYNTNMRLSKRIRDFFGTNATFYVEVFNLFNDKILNYSYIFSTPDAGSTNNRIAAYEHYAIDDPANGILYWQDTNSGGPFAVDQSFLIYSNSPRSFNFGFSLDL